MSTPGDPRCSPRWLALRESADAAARAVELLDPLRAYLAEAPGAGGERVVHDLGCGTGSMGRWLAGALPGPQRWILHDRDPELLAHASASVTGAAADGSPVRAVTRRGDITRLRAGDLRGASLVTASAVLDLLTAKEVEAIVAACAGAACPALLVLSVVGRVELDPADPLDMEVADAFNAHQRRTTRGRRLLGPEGAAVAAEAFGRRGMVVRSRPSPWRLGPEQAALAAEWLEGWVGAACEQRPELVRKGGTGGDSYLNRRLRECAAGRLRVVVHHSDLLALPTPSAGAP